MTLRAKKPETIEKRFKALFYGCAGVGKTTAAIQFPTPYLIDTERGAEHQQYIDILVGNGGVIFQTSDFEEIFKEVKTLLSEDHQYKTLIIDPLTTVFDNLCDTCAINLKLNSKEKNSDGMEFGRHIKEAGRRMKQLFNLLLRLDMNIIITSHSKNEWKNGASTNKQTFDCYNKVEYIFDLAIEIQQRERKRIGIVNKTRINSFELFEVFEFNYETILKKYGKEIIEKEAIKEDLATKEQVSEFNRLVKLAGMDEEQIAKWLDKAKSSTPSDMETSTIQKCIDHLKPKIEEKS